MIPSYENLDIQDLDGEIWKMDVEFPDKYAVSNLGRIKSLDREYVRSDGHIYQFKGRIRKQYFDKRHYFSIGIMELGKSKLLQVHRRVAMAFIPNPCNKGTVNHKDGNPKNNNIDNLEWMTQGENNIHSIRVLGAIRNTSGISSYWTGKKRPEVSEWTSKPRINFRGANSASSKKIKCDTLDMTFNSIREATTILGISDVSILKALKGVRLHIMGLTFRYI